MSTEELHFDTLKVRAGYDSKEHNHAVAVPIYQTASYDLGDTDRVERLLSFTELGHLYSRISNPTVAVLESRIAALDKGSAALALASGMAAISYTLLNLAEGGGRILTNPRIYGGSFDAFNKVFPKLGIEFDFVASEDPKDYEKAINSKTKAIFIETISNPNATLLDIEAIAAVAHNHKIPLVVDNTFATPFLFRPFEHGVDIIVYSATKAIGGHGNTIAGLVVESGKFNWANGNFPQFEEKQYLLRDRANDVWRNVLEAIPQAPFTSRIRLNYLAYLGATLSPFDAFLILQGLETLSERVSKQVSNAEEIIKYLERNPHVSWVNHPAAKGSKYAALAKKYFPKGAGAIFTFGFKGTSEQYDKFLNSVQIFSFHANVGDARSLIINTPKTTHGELTPEEQEFAGIPPETIRLSLGLEDPQDLIADLEQAFKKAFE